MKNFYKVTIVLIVLFFATTSSAYAHFVQTDKDITVLVHINPDDIGTAKELESSLYFQVTDRQKGFSGELCDCTLTISKNGKIIHSEKLFDEEVSDSNATVIPYIFPEIGVYQTKYSGKPIDGKSFQSFSFTYEIRVENEAELDFIKYIQLIFLQIPIYFIYIFGFVFLAVIIFLIVRFKKSKK